MYAFIYRASFSLDTILLSADGRWGQAPSPAPDRLCERKQHINIVQAKFAALKAILKLIISREMLKMFTIHMFKQYITLNLRT